MNASMLIVVLGIILCLSQTAEPTHHAARNKINPNSHGNIASKDKHRNKEPLNEKNPTRKHLAYDELSSSMIKTKLDDNLGRIPWSNNHKNVASYVDGGEGGLSQQKLLTIMNKLTNDIRVNGRRITPLQTQIVQQSSDGGINPSETMNDMQGEMQPNMQNGMQDDMQPNMQNGMQNDMQPDMQNSLQNDMQGNDKQNDDMQDDTSDNEVKPIDIPMNQKGSDSGPMMRPGMFENLMFGGLSQIMGGGRGGRGGGMTNVPGLSFGGGNGNGVINLMESENGLKPMTGMNGMGGMSRMNGMMNGMGGMNRMHGTMNGMGMMMTGMGRMRGKMWGRRPFFYRRGETILHKNNTRSKQTTFSKAKVAAPISNKQANKTHSTYPKIKMHTDVNQKT